MVRPVVEFEAICEGGLLLRLDYLIVSSYRNS